MSHWSIGHAFQSLAPSSGYSCVCASLAMRPSIPAPGAASLLGSVHEGSGIASFAVSFQHWLFLSVRKMTQDLVLRHQHGAHPWDAGAGGENTGISGVL